MTRLRHRLQSLIRRDGPLSLSAYMTLCLHDQEDGYYASRPGLGRDFITAPEISQVFGELIGLWLAHEWQEMGRPSPFALVEAGPGRATLMRDILRAGASVPGFTEASQLFLIEASPPLRRIQADRLETARPHFIDDIASLPVHMPVLFVANEWLDCLPANQFVRSGQHWHERLIGLDASGTLRFGLSEQPVPGDFAHLEKHECLEVQPGLETLTARLAACFSETPGRALFIDYGPDHGPADDSLRAYQNGRQIDPLQAPGLSDLTVDVDFSRLTRLAHGHGLSVAGPCPQGQFLQKLGIEKRLERLIQASPQHAETIFRAVQKLVDPEVMGTRFKAICLSSAGLPDATAF